MAIVVAGGAGFIGATLCRQVLARGDQVICVDSLVTGSADNVKTLTQAPGFVFVEADISSPLPALGMAGATVEAVINLACPASPVDFGPLAFDILAVSSRGVWQLLDLAVEHDAVYLQASTSEVYGDPLIHPQPESYWGNVNPIGPRSVYDEAKRFAEALTSAYRRDRDANTRIARIFNTYGPGMRPDDGRVISNFVTQALRGEPLTVYGDGSQTRSFCYVDDLVSGLLALAAAGYQDPVNLGNDEEWTMLDTARLVIELTGSASEISHLALPTDDPTQRRPDLSVARRQLGWVAGTTLRDGLERAIPYFARQIGAA
ncbi:MAG: GDP-mannose 4,6-dehydratase [Actinomycetota bacterium]|nr:GDP-mannose 4,6-dehydratase [Actinomycetota bacterium]